MRRYRAAKRAAGLRLARTWVEASSADTASWSDHSVIEARSLALHCLIARRLHANPELIEKARASLRRWKQRFGANLPAYFAEWEHVLAQPLPDVLAFITSTSAEAARLRQSTPFAGFLSPGERKRVYDAFRA
jgi:hypothetical protein